MYLKSFIVSLLLVACTSAHTVVYDELDKMKMEPTDAALYHEVWDSWWAYGMRAHPENDCFDGYDWHSTILGPGYQIGTPKLIMPKEVVVSASMFTRLCDHDGACLRDQRGAPVIVLSAAHMGDAAVEREQRAHAMLHWVVACTRMATPEANAAHELDSVWSSAEPDGDYVLRGFQD